jgi:hypothetical protein
MPINITAAGTAGTHSFARTNVNTDENFIFYKNSGGQTIPTALATVGTSFIYAQGAGSLTGVTDGQLVYIVTSNVREFKFSATSGGSPIDITGETAGSITFNTPTLFDGRLNIDASTPSNQAVKYFTNSTPMTGLVSGNTYFLSNVSISDPLQAHSHFTLLHQIPIRLHQVELQDVLVQILLHFAHHTQLQLHGETLIYSKVTFKDTKTGQFQYRESMSLMHEAPQALMAQARWWSWPRCDSQGSCDPYKG